jgi:glucan phosphoethanolaminetransferase (alkaline phosphatase superfamily)
MNHKLSKTLTIVVGLIGLIGFVFFARIVITGDESIKLMLADASISDSYVAPFISFAVLLLFATALIAIVFSIVNLVKHPDVLKRSLMGVGVMIVLLIGSYLFASDAAVTDVMGRVLENGEAGSVSKWVSTGINFSAILGVIGLGAFFVDFIKSLAK